RNSLASTTPAEVIFPLPDPISTPSRRAAGGFPDSEVRPDRPDPRCPRREDPAPRLPARLRVGRRKGEAASGHSRRRPPDGRAPRPPDRQPFGALRVQADRGDDPTGGHGPRPAGPGRPATPPLPQPSPRSE